jgi:hypothetical protein
MNRAKSSSSMADILLKSNRHGVFGKVVVVYLALLAGSGCGKQSRAAWTPHEVLGEEMAQKTMELCHGKGSLVLVTGEEGKSNPAISETVDAFRKALNGSLRIEATETVLVPLAMSSGLDLLSAEKFQELLQKHASADVLVSFVGIPHLTTTEIAALPSPRPKVVEVISFNLPAKTMFAQGVVCLVALAKPASGEEAKGTHSKEELFDAQYQLITTETANSLPD